MSEDFLPRQDVALTDSASRASNPFYVWFLSLERALQSGTLSVEGLQEQISDIATALGSPDGTVANIPTGVFLPTTTNVLGFGSIRSFGTLAGGIVQITLQGDDENPGNTYYYGTGPDGEKGFYPIADALIEGDGIALSVGLDGKIEIAHGDTSSVADISASFTGGTVPDQIALTFDAFGHVLTRTITGRTLDHNDTGALQGGNATERYHFTAAEHTGLLPWASEDPDDYALITQTITNGDTTHAPSGDAVFDALAGKGNLSGGNTWSGTQTGLNADLTDGYHADEANTASTLAARDSSGDIRARLFRPQFTATNPTIGYFITQVEVGTGNTYMRPSTPTQALAALGLASGSYTTTAATLTNLDSVGTVDATYIRVDGNVFVSGTCDADPTAVNTLTSFRVPLPIVSNLTAQTQLTGGGGINGGAAAGSEGFRVLGVVADGTAEVRWFARETLNRRITFWFMYPIL